MLDRYSRQEGQASTIALGVHELRAVAVGGRLVADHRVHEAKSRDDPVGRPRRAPARRWHTSPHNPSGHAATLGVEPPLHADVRLVRDGLVLHWRRQCTVVAAMEVCAEVADGQWGGLPGPEGAPGPG